MLTFTSALGQKPVTLTSPLLRNGWIFVHVVLIFTGYAGLFLSFGASLLYLAQERALKSKSQTALLAWLPPLADHRRHRLSRPALRLSRS